MHLPHLLTALLAPLHVLAIVQFTNNDFKGITAGQAFTLTWSGDGTPATITLMNGPIKDLAKVSTVAASATGTRYSWTPASTIEAGTYVLSIAQSGATNYSPEFPIGSTNKATPAPPTSGLPAPSPPTKSFPQLSSYPQLTSYPPPTSGTWAAFTKLEAQAAMVTGEGELRGVNDGPGQATLRASTVPWDANGPGWCESEAACPTNGGLVSSGSVAIPVGRLLLVLVVGGLVTGFVLLWGFRTGLRG